jgi:hypothetical protein
MKSILEPNPIFLMTFSKMRVTFQNASYALGCFLISPNCQQRRQNTKDQRVLVQTHNQRKNDLTLKLNTNESVSLNQEEKTGIESTVGIFITAKSILGQNRQRDAGLPSSRKGEEVGRDAPSLKRKRINNKGFQNTTESIDWLKISK